MRISDWSPDVGSSDLVPGVRCLRDGSDWRSRLRDLLRFDRRTGHARLELRLDPVLMRLGVEVERNRRLVLQKPGTALGLDLLGMLLQETQPSFRADLLGVLNL